MKERNKKMKTYCEMIIRVSEKKRDESFLKEII